MKEFRRLFHLGLWGPDVRQGVDWEIEHHLEERIDQLMASGLPRGEAEREARRAFGDVERFRRELRYIDRERERRMRMLEWLETVGQDVRYAMRGVRRNPGFAASLVLTLALGIGANAALFAVVDALLLRPLPYRAPAELSELVWHDGERAEPAVPGMPYIAHDFAREWQAGMDVQDVSVLHNHVSALYMGGTEPQSVALEAVSAAFEETLGIAPMLGRGLLPEDARPGAPAVALLSYDFWSTQLGRDGAVLGRAIELDGVPHEVIGVMPRGFKFPEYATREAWVPLATDGTALGRPLSSVFVKVRVPEARFARASAQATSYGRVLSATQPSRQPRSYGLQRWSEQRARNQEVRQAVSVLGGAVVLILLLAGFNTVNLLLVRAASRTRELSVRLAIGASRRRVVRQLATEAMILALASGVAAVLVALLALRGMRDIMPHALTFFSPYDFSVESRTLAFTFVLAVGSGFAFGVLPALRAVRRTRPARDAGLTTYAGRTRETGRLRRALVVAEVAISVMLLAAGGLFINSFVRLVNVHPGLDFDRLGVLVIDVSSSAYPDAESRMRHLRTLEAGLEAVPGVIAVSLASGLPPHGDISFGVELEPEAGVARKVNGVLPSIDASPDFFQVTGALLLAGRAFREGEPDGSVIIDEDMAAALWPGRSAVGRSFRMWRDAEPLTVVGVMRDLRLRGPDDRDGEFALLRPMAGRGGNIAYAIRTQGDLADVLPAIRRAVYQVDPRQPILSLGPAAALYAEAVQTPRFLLVLVSALAAFALLLASVGIYAVLAFGVAQRKQELAVRMALGAGRPAVRALVLREGAALAAAGAAAGLAGALLLARFLRAALFGVEPTDPLTLLLVVSTMLLAALLACVIPARRATALDPMRILRGE